MVGSGQVRLAGSDGVVDGDNGGLELLQAASIDMAISRQWRGLGMAAVVLELAGVGQLGGLLLYPVGDGGQTLGLGGVVGHRSISMGRHEPSAIHRHQRHHEPGQGARLMLREVLFFIAENRNKMPASITEKLVTKMTLPRR